ncbi:MAG: ankyrin repeat domain-containing protein [Chitinophagaceae bacterium]|nr:ankyrin repeat domain-containing protein [Chitinophagaceae bacterium]
MLILSKLLRNDIPAKVLINALCYSVSNSHLACCKLLLDKGADINGVGLYGSTPLSTAAGKLEIEIADLLLQRGANVNAADDIGRTPLLVAIQHFADISFLRLLLDAGADANIVDYRGLTPLWATLLDNGSPDIMRLLFEYGADGTRPYFGKTLLQIARKNGLAVFVQILGEQPNQKNRPISNVTA